MRAYLEGNPLTEMTAPGPRALTDGDGELLTDAAEQCREAVREIARAAAAAGTPALWFASRQAAAACEAAERLDDLESVAVAAFEAGWRRRTADVETSARPLLRLVAN